LRVTAFNFLLPGSFVFPLSLLPIAKIFLLPHRFFLGRVPFFDVLQLTVAPSSRPIPPFIDPDRFLCFFSTVQDPSCSVHRECWMFFPQLELFFSLCACYSSSFEVFPPLRFFSRASFPRLHEPSLAFLLGLYFDFCFGSFLEPLSHLFAALPTVDCGGRLKFCPGPLDRTRSNMLEFFLLLTRGAMLLCDFTGPAHARLCLVVHFLSPRCSAAGSFVISLAFFYACLWVLPSPKYPPGEVALFPFKSNAFSPPIGRIDYSDRGLPFGFRCAVSRFPFEDPFFLPLNKSSPLFFCAGLPFFPRLFLTLTMADSWVFEKCFFAISSPYMRFMIKTDKRLWPLVAIPLVQPSSRTQGLQPFPFLKHTPSRYPE